MSALSADFAAMRDRTKGVEGDVTMSQASSRVGDVPAPTEPVGELTAVGALRTHALRMRPTADATTNTDRTSMKPLLAQSPANLTSRTFRLGIPV